LKNLGRIVIKNMNYKLKTIEVCMYERT